jgi:hypothetical protein
MNTEEIETLEVSGKSFSTEPSKSPIGFWNCGFASMRAGQISNATW